MAMPRTSQSSSKAGRENVSGQSSLPRHHCSSTELKLHADPAFTRASSMPLDLAGTLEPTIIYTLSKKEADDIGASLQVRMGLVPPEVDDGDTVATVVALNASPMVCFCIAAGGLQNGCISCRAQRHKACRCPHAVPARQAGRGAALLHT